MSVEKKTSKFRVGEFVLRTYGEEPCYGIGQLLRCIQDCEIAKGVNLYHHPAFQVVAFWKVHGDAGVGTMDE